jgi:energy-coupling factor transport system substrate-specific component
MKQQRGHFFSLHDLLVMAALAALGGVSGSLVGWIGGLLHAVTGQPGGLQFLAGIHVLWLILAVGLIRKPGAATLTAALKGSVELLFGNKLGLYVVLITIVAGVCVDLIWLLAGRRHRLPVYMLAGGVAAASNLVVFKIIYSLPDHAVITGLLTVLVIVAFVSGVVLAGLLGWSLMNALARAGVTGVYGPSGAPPPQAGAWASVGMIGIVALVIGAAIFYVKAREVGGSPGTPSTQPTTMPAARSDS